MSKAFKYYFLWGVISGFIFAIISFLLKKFTKFGELSFPMELLYSLAIGLILGFIFLVVGKVWQKSHGDGKRQVS